VIDGGRMADIRWLRFGTIGPLVDGMKSITVKNIPDAIYERLKESAETNRRSLNSEIIACLERSVVLRRLDVEQIIQRADEIRARIKGPKLKTAEIIRARDRGRK
jgi:plasmid stability protein